MWPDMKMDVREMSGFESGSFDAIVDKGLLLFYFFSFFISFGNACWIISD